MGPNIEMECKHGAADHSGTSQAESTMFSVENSDQRSNAPPGIQRSVDEHEIEFVAETAVDLNRSNCAESPCSNWTKWTYNYQEATIYLDEGENNEKFTSHPHNRESLPAYMLVHNALFYICDLGASLLLLSMAVVEPPAYPLLQIPVWVHASVEIILLFIVGLESFMKVRWQGWKTFLSHRRSALKALTLAIMAVETIVVIVRQESHLRVTRALRPIFLIDNHYCGGVRRFIRQIFQSLPPILDMLILIFTFVLVFSLIGFSIFGSNPQDPYFSSLETSFVSLFVLLTTANYPDVMMPAYKESRWASAFFVIYLLVVLYFLMNLMLAVTYERFTCLEKEKFRRLFLHKREACHHAFNLLLSQGQHEGITFSRFHGLLSSLHPKQSELSSYLAFKALGGKAPDSVLTREQFSSIHEIRRLKWTRAKCQESQWHSGLPHVIDKICTGLHTVIQTKLFHCLVYIIILANGLLMALNVSSMMHEIYMAWVFLVLFIIEAVMKLLALGWRGYLSSGWNTFDLVATLAYLVGLLAHAIGGPSSLVIVVQPLRLLRLFKIKKRYRDVFGTMALLFPRMLSASLVLTLLYYFCAIIGMELFASYNLRDCCKNTSVEDYYRDLNSISRYDGLFYLNNFSNLFSSGMTLFELMVVNNWHVIMEGYAAVTGSAWSRCYFMAFYLVTMVVLTITVSVFLEAFLFRIQYKRTVGSDLGGYVCKEVSLSREEVERLEPNCYSYATLHNDMGLGEWKFVGKQWGSKSVMQKRMYQDEIPLWVAQHENDHPILS